METINTDVLIIGGGGAALRAAIEAREQDADVLVLSHSRVGYGSNTTISGGGFAAVAGPARGFNDPRDSAVQHFRDTVAGGRFLANQSLVSLVAQGANAQVSDLERFGIEFADPAGTPWLALTIDPGHTYRRTIYGRNAFGTDFTFPLRVFAIDAGVKFLEGVLVVELLLDERGTTGVLGVDREGNPMAISAGATILATGGSGQMYARNDNAPGSTGDGYVLAYEAGATLADMEFVQYYPIGLGDGTKTLFYENALNAGGRLLNSAGEDICARYGLNSSMEMTRDWTSRAMALEASASNGDEETVMLDLRGISADDLERLLPALPKAVGRGVLQFRVSPTVHFHMGGVRINERCETGIPGLFAVGEVCAGVHGANRLGGNALTELWVFGQIAGREAARMAKEHRPLIDGRSPENRVAELISHVMSRDERQRPGELQERLKKTMWWDVGLIRGHEGLERGLRDVQQLNESVRDMKVETKGDLHLAFKVRNMLTVAEMVCRSALLRKESRGAHYRSDYPERDDQNWLRNVLISKTGKEMALTTEPVNLSHISPW